MHPAKAAHWDGSAGKEPVIVQIIGEGPAQTVQVDPKQPMWVKVARQRLAIGVTLLAGHEGIERRAGMIGAASVAYGHRGQGVHHRIQILIVVRLIPDPEVGRRCHEKVLGL